VDERAEMLKTRFEGKWLRGVEDYEGDGWLNAWEEGTNG
jgi:hypothetical protein